MAKRTYQQFCPLAYALDTIGERWTLLIVRELGLGPRRFSDLQRGLPGLSPNLLSQRLKTLETRGVIEQQPLPPPAKLLAYALTHSGRALSEALMPLAQWGAQFLRLPFPEGEYLGAIPAMTGLRLLFHPSLAAQEMLTVEVRLAPDCFRLCAAATDLRIEQGFLPSASLVLSTKPKPLLGLAAGMLTVEAAQHAGDLRIDRGSAELAERLFAQFSFPTAGQA